MRCPRHFFACCAPCASAAAFHAFPLPCAVARATPLPMPRAPASAQPTAGALEAPCRQQFPTPAHDVRAGVRNSRVIRGSPLIALQYCAVNKKPYLQHTIYRAHQQKQQLTPSPALHLPCANYAGALQQRPTEQALSTEPYPQNRLSTAVLGLHRPRTWTSPPRVLGLHRPIWRLYCRRLTERPSRRSEPVVPISPRSRSIAP